MLTTHQTWTPGQAHGRQVQQQVAAGRLVQTVAAVELLAQEAAVSVEARCNHCQTLLSACALRKSLSADQTEVLLNIDTDHNHLVRRVTAVEEQEAAQRGGSQQIPEV